jgi:pre-mRNA-splicing factor ISY1
MIDALPVRRYFGRAKELPGVRELFSSAVKEQSEIESYKTVKITMFDNAPPEYYGNEAELGQAGKRLLEEERKAEEAGSSHFAFLP